MSRRMATLVMLPLFAVVTIIMMPSMAQGATPTNMHACTIHVTGFGQSAVIGTVYSNPVTATVLYGTEPISGASVTFTMPTTPSASAKFVNGDTVVVVPSNGTGVAIAPGMTATTTFGTWYMHISAVPPIGAPCLSAIPVSEAFVVAPGAHSSSKPIPTPVPSTVPSSKLSVVTGGGIPVRVGDGLMEVVALSGIFVLLVLLAVLG